MEKNPTIKVLGIPKRRKDIKKRKFHCLQLLDCLIPPSLYFCNSQTTWICLAY